VKDWKSIAKASGLETSGEEWDRIVGPLNSLEDAFRPLVEDLAVDVEPASGICDQEWAE
jgi:hypothetical protein